MNIKPKLKWFFKLKLKPKFFYWIRSLRASWCAQPGCSPSCSWGIPAAPPWGVETRVRLVESREPPSGKKMVAGTASNFAAKNGWMWHYQQCHNSLWGWKLQSWIPMLLVPDTNIGLQLILISDTCHPVNFLFPYVYQQTNFSCLRIPKQVQTPRACPAADANPWTRSTLTLGLEKEVVRFSMCVPAAWGSIQ